MCDPQVDLPAVGNGPRQIHILITPLIGYEIQIKYSDSNTLRIKSNFW